MEKCTQVLTDGTALTNTQGVVDTFSMPMHSTPGSELVREPFRWDQRVCCTVLQLPGAVFGALAAAGMNRPNPCIPTI